MQVPGVEYTESFSIFATETSTSIMIGIILFHKEEGWFAEICDMESAFVHLDMTVEMFIKCHEGIVELDIITKEFMEEYYILLGK